MNYKHKKNINLIYGYEGEDIGDCHHMILASLYEDTKTAVMVIHLCTATGATIDIKHLKGKYLLCLTKGESLTSSTDLTAFNNFPKFLDFIKGYNPSNLSLYTYEYTSPIGTKPIFKDFQPLCPQSLNVYVEQYIWALLMAGIHNEHYNHGGSKEEVAYKEIIDKVDYSDYKPSLLANLVTCDQYASYYYGSTVLKIQEAYIVVDGNISDNLPVIAYMLSHNSRNIDDHISEIGSEVWDTLIKNLRRFGRLTATDLRKLLPEVVYNAYLNACNKLSDNNDYLIAIAKQLLKYTYNESVDEYDYREVYTLEKGEDGKYTERLKWANGATVTDLPFEKPLSFNAILNDSTDYVAFYKDSHLHDFPVKSFNIDEYKEIIKSEYELLEEVKSYKEEFEDEILFGDMLTTSAWNMAIFNDCEVAFFIGYKEIGDMYTGINEVQEYLSLTGRTFIINENHPHQNDILYTICFVTEDIYNDSEFREKYPKLAAMYNRGLKLYHEYVAHGEKNPVSEGFK